jgi:predicted outer membrane repeat protein
MLKTCSLDIQGNASFTGNKAGHGGAMALKNTNSNINGNLYLSKNVANWGGALSIIEGNFIIKGYTLFDSNHGGSIHIQYANFMFCGNVNSGSSNNSFDTGALHAPLNKAKAFDPELFTDTTLTVNNSITFLGNSARYGGGFIYSNCWNSSTTFIGTVYFNESYDTSL